MYTKGEWKQNEFTMRDGFGGEIKHIFISSNSGEFSERTLADIGFWRDFPEDMVKANANLIAAAPEMYEALKLLIERFEGMPKRFSYPIALDLPRVWAEKALAKAEGKNG